MRVRLTGNSIIVAAIAVLAFFAIDLLLSDNPQFIAWARASGLTFSIQHSQSLNPFSNHLAYTVVGPMASSSLKKKIYAQAGQTISIQYQCSFENHSTPLISLYQPGFVTKAVWRESVKRTAGGATVTAPATGFYEMNFSPWGFNGSFDIWWDVK